MLPVDVPISPVLQVVAVANAWVLKPAYMLLALVLIRRLRHAVAPDLVLLRRGLAVFLAGEAACAVNFVAFAMGSVSWEMAHDLGMALSAGLLVLAALEMADGRIVFQFAEGKPCSFFRFCRSCPVREGQPCRFAPLFVLISLAGAFLACLPLTAPAVLHHAMRTVVFGYPYVQDHLPVYQIFENRVCPVVAIVLFLVAAVSLLVRRPARPTLERALFALAVGVAAFAIFRFSLHRIYWNVPVWSDFWEESTELLAVVAVAIGLWLFADRLPIRPAEAAEE